MSLACALITSQVIRLTFEHVQLCFYVFEINHTKALFYKFRRVIHNDTLLLY